MIDTRAEAEEWKNTKEYLDRYPTMHEYAEGKRINPKLTDLISRADAIEAVASITMSIHLSDVICDKLLALPSAKAVQGEWEFVDNEIFAGEYFCSVCGKRAEVDLYGEWILSNFCPSCGARMLREDGEA